MLKKKIIPLGIILVLFTSCSIIINFREELSPAKPSQKKIQTVEWLTEKDENLSINKQYFDDNNKFFFHVTNKSQYYLNLDIGIEKKKVYLVFTNPETSGLKYPRISHLSAASKSLTNKIVLKKIKALDILQKPSLASYIEKWNEKGIQKNITRAVNKPTSSLYSDKIGDKKELFGYSTKLDNDNKPVLTKIPSTCQLVREVMTAFGTKKLIIWLADDCYITWGTKDKLINNVMIQEFADKFLKEGRDNDIYDWVTNILGEEWSDVSNKHNFLIPEKNEITLFLYDINNEDSNTKDTAGFFWKKDNYKKNTQLNHESNERLMIYLNAAHLADYDENTGSSWKITDYWPSYLVSTLAHEFQHMINYHQKRWIQNNDNSTSRWLDEMMAMCIQELIADKIESNALRGVKYDDYSAGPKQNQTGRLGMFNYMNELSVLVKEDERFQDVHYSHKYAVGAYLIRNFGGANFLRDLLYNQYTDTRAISYALDKAGSSSSLADVLMKWGTAVVISDSEHEINEYQYNRKSSSMINNITYNLGAINLYNYLYSGNNMHLEGPYFYTARLYYDNTGFFLNPTSNYYFQLGEDLSGKLDYLITMDPKTRMTVIVK